MKLILIKKLILSGIFILSGHYFLYGQTKIAITIDDVPNTRKFQLDNYRSILLEKLDSLNIPIAIFVNEGFVAKTDSFHKNLDLLTSWVSKDYTTIGNHTHSHSRYSEVGFDAFKTDIEKGEVLLKELTNKHGKTLKHFRFPYNDLGIDSIQHTLIDRALRKKNYMSTPFTIESSDWMFNYIYEYYLSSSDLEKAKEIGQLYVDKTIDYIHFFDSLSYAKYGRKVNQIYLCHDNYLNADYLTTIIDQLKKESFNFISIDEAIQDPAYDQEYKYYKKWGVSWFYRWMSSQKERVKWMKIEPDISKIELLYNTLIEQNN